MKWFERKMERFRSPYLLNAGLGRNLHHANKVKLTYGNPCTMPIPHTKDMVAHIMGMYVNCMDNCHNR